MARETFSAELTLCEGSEDARPGSGGVPQWMNWYGMAHAAMAAVP